MSLINDALKRASRQQKNPPPGSGTPMRPVEPRKSGDASQWILPGMIILLIVAACFFIGLAMARHTVAQIEHTPEVAATQAVETVSVPVVPPPTNVEPEIPAGPLFKVQGIVYDPARPWAIINGKTVFVGDRLGNFRVKTINRHNVILQAADGSETKLGL